MPIEYRPRRSGGSAESKLYQCPICDSTVLTAEPGKPLCPEHQVPMDLVTR
jgi:hypothetical protein